MDYVVRRRVCCCLVLQAQERHSLVRITVICGMLFSFMILLIFCLELPANIYLFTVFIC